MYTRNISKRAESLIGKILPHRRNPERRSEEVRRVFEYIRKLRLLKSSVGSNLVTVFFGRNLA